MAGIFERLGNVWRGFLSLWISDIESRNPEAVYEAAIGERVSSILTEAAESGWTPLEVALSRVDRPRPPC